MYAVFLSLLTLATAIFLAPRLWTAAFFAFTGAPFRNALEEAFVAVLMEVVCMFSSITP
jgi:hypothetical protein